MKKLLGSLLISIILLSGCTHDNNDKIQITFSSWGSKTEYSILKEIINDYEKQNPTIQIELIHVPENYFRKLHLLYAAKTPPDVVFLNNTYAPLYINSDLLEDLTGIVDENEFFESAINCFRYDNKLYAIPRDISNLAIFVNKDIIRKPSLVQTVYDLRYYAKQYTNKEHFGLNYEKNPLFWLTYLNCFNGGILSDDGKTVILNQPEGLMGLKFYTDMINIDNSVPKEWQTSSMTSAQMFISGKTAMYLSGHWVIPKFRETIKFDWDIIPVPLPKDAKTLADASGWGISKSSEHKNEAIDFVKYLSSKEVSEKFTETGLITPARKDTAAWELDISRNLKPKHLQIFTDTLRNSKPTPVNSNYTKIVDEVTKTVVPVFNGQKNIDEIENTDFINKLQKYCDKSN